MAQNPKQNCCKPSGTMCRCEGKKSINSNDNDNSTQWQSVSSGGAITSNNDNSVQWHSVSDNSDNSTQFQSITSGNNSSQIDSNAKSHGIRGFLKLLPFMPRFMQKTLSSKQKNARKQTSSSRIRICPSSTLEEQDIRKLIALYQSYENLYNPNNADFGNTVIEYRCYAQISTYFPNKTSQELQNLLYELRLLFEREYTIIENGYRRLGQVLQPTIRYFNEFLFLVPFLKIRWDSRECLLNRTQLPEESSENSCTSDGTDGSSSSFVAELPLELVESSTIIDNANRPAAGRNQINPMYGNQFMSCYKKNKKPQQSDSDTLIRQPTAEEELDSGRTERRRLSKEQEIAENRRREVENSKGEWEPVKQVAISEEEVVKEVQILTPKRLSEQPKSSSTDVQTSRRGEDSRRQLEAEEEKGSREVQTSRRLSRNLESNKDIEPLDKEGFKEVQTPRRLSREPESLKQNEPLEEEGFREVQTSRKLSREEEYKKQLEPLEEEGFREVQTPRRQSESKGLAEQSESKRLAREQQEGSGSAQTAKGVQESREVSREGRNSSNNAQAPQRQSEQPEPKGLSKEGNERTSNAQTPRRLSEQPVSKGLSKEGQDKSNTVQPRTSNAQTPRRPSEQAKAKGLSKEEKNPSNNAQTPKRPSEQPDATKQNVSVDSEPPKPLSSQLEPSNSKRNSQMEANPKNNQNAATTSQKALCQCVPEPKNCAAYCNSNSQQRTSSCLRNAGNSGNSRRTLNPQNNPGNEQQLQMLCDMIKMELSSSPDFIYYDAKWRIIEILREVQKRNLIHNKSEPNKGNICTCNKNRLQGPMKSMHCPYCKR